MSLFSADPTEAAFVRFRAGDLIGAEEGFRNILAREPGQPDALHGMACLARARGQDATAIALVGLALQKNGISPDRKARMHITLGLALIAQGHAEAARAALNVSVILQPSDPRAHAALGEAFERLGRRGEARAALEKAVALSADDTVVRTRLGALFLDDGLVEQAIGQFRKIVQHRPQDGHALANLGAALFVRNAFDEAVTVLSKACEQGARTAETLNSLGLVKMALGDLCAACETLQEALQLRPSDGRIANSLGTVLMEIGRLEEAEALFGAIVMRESGEEADRARFNRATILLGQGKFAEGWRDFESRRSLLRLVSDVPQWDGSTGEESVAVVGEQGLGDEVQFLRFLTLAAKRRPLRLRLRAAALAELMPELDQGGILPAEGPVVAEVSLLSLPAVLGMDDVPSTEPYLAVSEKPEARRIGVCWSGNPSYRFDRRRSVPVGCLDALQQVRDVRFVALQPGDAPGWMERVSLETPMDLAREVGRCALVVSVDTLVAHVAGALGRPLWLLNREGGDWRWKDVDWYGGVRQFRPPSGAAVTAGWEAVLREVAQALSSRVW
ncbi:tetratricopeptide repeat protein [Gluconobacter sphaericus]|uniref:tetratricopeptide repeat protein n=1 Tax=Gluconobacter sphaericus TaxID=574987 RepID=UPI0019226646|nr:tetratricopeptide repeat protein [Gluconobacter sphaericus]QQX90636.1 tetratricopeptide repeat protein [Gluconobacter sphaericus]